MNPFKWFGGQYVAMQGQFADDASYLNPRGGRKNQIAAIDFYERLDLLLRRPAADFLMARNRSEPVPAPSATGKTPRRSERLKVGRASRRSVPTAVGTLLIGGNNYPGVGGLA